MQKSNMTDVMTCAILQKTEKKRGKVQMDAKQKLIAIYDSNDMDHASTINGLTSSIV